MYTKLQKSCQRNQWLIESVSDRVTHWAVRWWLKNIWFKLRWTFFGMLTLFFNLWKFVKNIKYKKSKITKNEEYKSHEWWALNTFGRINIFKIGEHFQNRWTFSKEVNGGGGGDLDCGSASALMLTITMGEQQLHLYGGFKFEGYWTLGKQKNNNRRGWGGMTFVTSD